MISDLNETKNIGLAVDDVSIFKEIQDRKGKL